MFSPEIEAKLNDADLYGARLGRVMHYVCELSGMSLEGVIPPETLQAYSELPGGIGPYVIDTFTDWLMDTAKELRKSWQ